jgi:hypothetical protein
MIVPRYNSGFVKFEASLLVAAHGSRQNIQESIPGAIKGQSAVVVYWLPAFPLVVPQAD